VDLFPITFHEVSNGVWTAREVRRPVYTDIAESDSFCSMDPLTVSAIDDVEPKQAALEELSVPIYSPSLSS
jgi:hypothetical protein